MTNATGNSPQFQLYGSLPAPIEAALRASIKAHGVLVPVAVDQHGRILDGHHRWRIAEEEGVDCPTTPIRVDSDEHGDEIARTLNADRRQLDEDTRRKVVAELRANGHSVRAIAGALGVGKSTVDRDLGSGVPRGTPAQNLGSESRKTVTGTDGKTYPAKQSKPAAKKAKKPAPPAADKLQARVTELEATLAETKEALAEMTDLAASAKAFEEKDEFKQMQVLRLELRSCKRRRDELMAENAEMKKMLGHWKKRAEKAEAAKK